MCKRAFSRACLLSRLFQQHLHWLESEVGCHAHYQRHACMTPDRMINERITIAHQSRQHAGGRQEVNVRAPGSKPSSTFDQLQC